MRGKAAIAGLAWALLACDDYSPAPRAYRAATPSQAAACESTERRNIYVDADGDGFSVGAAVGSRCEEDGAGDGYTFNPPGFGGADCDDDDPERHRGDNYYTDADGDGYGVPMIGHLYDCEGVTIEGLAPNADDCDDDDPDVQLHQYPDADEDGFGAGTASACVSSEEPEHSPVAGDCDDENDEVHPLAEEKPLDGVDSDCDGAQFPNLFACEAPFEPDSDTALPQDCSGPDIFIAGASSCADCENGGRFWLVVGNAGAEPAEVDLALNPLSTYFDDFEEILIELQEPIAPGALSPVIIEALPAPGAELELRLRDGSADCSDADESVSLEIGFIECIR